MPGLVKPNKILKNSKLFRIILSKFNNFILYYVFNEIIVSCKGSLYSYLFNLRSRILNYNSRVSFKSSSYKFVDLRIPELEWHAAHERHASFTYIKGFYERIQDLEKSYMLNLIDFKDGDLILDCGANVGDLKLWVKIKKQNLRYVGFEPSPIEFEHLKKNISPSKAYNVGLWNKNDQLTFYVSSQGGDSSLIKPLEYDEKIKVKTIRLEEFITQKIKLLKLESEGAEPEILEGIGDKINNIQYITADLGFERGLNEESTLVPVTNFLLNKNFELVEWTTHKRIAALYKNKNFIN